MFTASTRLSPIRPWFKTVTRHSMRSDFIAGMTNAAIVLPQGVAFAIIAGLPPEYGLFTAVIVTAVAALWGSSMIMVSGPTTAISAVVFATLSEFAAPGTAYYISLALTLTLMVGVFQFAAGFAGLGALIAFVSHSVIVGFTAAAAILIGASQLAGVFGIESGPGGSVFERLVHVWHNIGTANTYAVIVSATTLGTLLAVIWVNKKLPAYIIALVAGSLAAYVLGGTQVGLSLFSPLPSAIPSFSVPNLSPGTLSQLLPGAIAIAFVGLLEAISIGKSFAMRRGERYDSNQEMVGQGLSNMVGSFLQSYAGSGSFTRSGLNAESGAQSPLAALFAAAILLVSLIIVAPLVRFVPHAAMATIILYVAWRLINFDEITHLVKASRSETLILGLTFVTGLVSELDFAILVGVLTSLAVFLNKSSHPTIGLGAPMEVNGRRVFRNVYENDLPECPQIAHMKLEGPLFFASIEHIDSKFREVEARFGSKRTIVLNLKGVGKIDLSGADFLISEFKSAQARGQDFHLIASNRMARDTLEKLHVIDVMGHERVHFTKTDAIAASVGAASDDICRTCPARIFNECASKPKAQSSEATTNLGKTS